MSERDMASLAADAEWLERIVMTEARWKLERALLWIGRGVLDTEALTAERYWEWRFKGRGSKPVEYPLGFPVQGGTIVGLVRDWLVQKHFDLDADLTPSLSAATPPDGFDKPLAMDLKPRDNLVRHARPDAELLTALRQGDVIAYGVRNGYGREKQISPLEWEDLAFADTDNDIEGGTAASSLSGNPYFWARLAFDRASVVAAFPAGPSNDWRLEPGGILKMWVPRPAVLAEVQRRLDHGLTRKTGYPGVLMEMSEDSGQPASYGAIAKVYADLGKPTAPSQL